VESVYYATHFSPATSSQLPVARKLVEKIRAKYGKDADYIHAEAYDAGGPEATIATRSAPRSRRPTWTAPAAAFASTRTATPRSRPTS